MRKSRLSGGRSFRICKAKENFEIKKEKEIEERIDVMK